MPNPLDDIDPLAPDTVECPFPFYDAIRSESPVYRVPMEADVRWTEIEVHPRQR